MSTNQFRSKQPKEADQWGTLYFTVAVPGGKQNYRYTAFDQNDVQLENLSMFESDPGAHELYGDVLLAIEQASQSGENVLYNIGWLNKDPWKNIVRWNRLGSSASSPVITGKNETAGQPPPRNAVPAPTEQAPRATGPKPLDPQRNSIERQVSAKAATELVCGTGASAVVVYGDAYPLWDKWFFHILARIQDMDIPQDEDILGTIEEGE